MELTEEAREVIKSASKDMKGSALRRFMADIVRKLGRGGQRKAQRELGWGRDTIRKGEHELRTGIECVDGRCGNRAGVDERLPNLKADINDVVECWSQTDPRFRTTQRYVRLTVLQVAKRLLENEWNGDLLDTIEAAVGHARSMTWHGQHPTVIEWFDKTYEKGKRLGKEAMQAIEDRIKRLPGLQKWFVDIAPLPT
jgi:hypothetical protein